MRRSEQESAYSKSNILKKLREEAVTGDLLPMPHNICERGHIIFEEWEEWKQRQTLHRDSEPNYDDNFRRPSTETTLKIWELLDQCQFHSDSILPTHYKTFMDDKDKSQREFAARQAFIIVLYTFVMTEYSHRQVTYLNVFNALCRGFSDQYQKLGSTVDTVRDMLDVTVKRCRRDLLLAGVDPKKLWDAVINWKDNPFFGVGAICTGNKVYKRVVFNNAEWGVRDQFLMLIRQDPNYAHEQLPGIKVLFAEKELPKKRPERCKVCAERPYNVVRLNEKSEQLLKLQESVTLYMDISNFNEDYKKALDSVKKASEALNDPKRFGIDPNLSNNAPFFQDIKSGKKQTTQTIWSERTEYVYYRSIEVGILKGGYKNVQLTQADLTSETHLAKFHRHIEKFGLWIKEHGQQEKRTRIFQWLEACKLRFEKDMSRFGENSKSMPIPAELMFFKVDKAMRGWRGKVRMLLEEYDAAHLHVLTFKNVYDQVENLTGLKEIHSGFYRIHTRRYQPIHFWPTYVTSKNRHEKVIGEADEEGNNGDVYVEKTLASYRQRWFKAKHPKTSAACNLAGFDISSSQMQIIAVFLDDNKLRKISMAALDKPSFKEKMAEWAWRMNGNGKLRLKAGSSRIKAYQDAKDDRLLELVKGLLMKVSYGSTWKAIEEDQRFRPEIYGPGWEEGSAGKFIREFDKEYPGPQTFRQICRRAAELAYKKDPYQGIIFKDPFDQAEVRWNPVAREEYSVRSGDSLRISLPLGFKAAKEAGDSQNIVTGKPNKDGDYPVDPSELIKMAAPCLVHLLDAYYSSLVMSRLASKGVSTFVGIHDCWLAPESQIDELTEAMEWAAKEWYSGLGPIYETLLDYLDDDKKNKSFVEKAYTKWKKRQGDKWQKRCGSKWSPRFRAKRVNI